MKKVILSTIVLLLSTSAFANKAKVTTLENANNFDIEINVERLSNYLELNTTQFSETEEISDYFTWQLETSKNKSEAKKQAYVRKAVYVNLKSMKQILSDTQYKKYLQVMNTTLKNKDLWDYVVAIN